MNYDADRHHRRSIRLQGYDYSQSGGYFVTICVHDRMLPKGIRTFGEIVNGKLMINECGKIAHQFWMDIPNRFANVELDEFIIMPNHIHGIVVNHNGNIVGAGFTPAQSNRSYAIGLPIKTRRYFTYKIGLSTAATNDGC